MDYRNAREDRGASRRRLGIGLRGGAFDSQAKSVGSAARFRYDYDVRYPANGFRVVRELP